MAANLKIDKETLIKHRFWFLLPAVLLCLLIGWICVLGVRSEAEENQTKANKTYADLRGIKADAALRNDKWVAEMALRKLASQSQKNVIWQLNYDLQNGVSREAPKLDATPGTTPGTAPAFGKVQAIRDPLLTWPAETVAEWNKNNRGRASLELHDFGEYLGIIPFDYKDHYRMQFDKVVELLPWLDEGASGDAGAIRVLGDAKQHKAQALRLLAPHDLKVNNRDVDYREAWMLQEDLAIRRELFRNLASVIDNYALMQPEWRGITAAEAAANNPRPAAGAAPAAGEPAPVAPAAAPPAVPEEPGTVIDQASYYNFVWPVTLLAGTPPPAGAAPNAVPTVPTLEPWQGWQLDLQLVVQDRKRLLRGTALNYAPQLKVPPATVRVYFIDGPSGAELPQPIDLEDAGDLAPAKLAADGQLSEPSRKKLKAVEVPAGARISRVVRKVQGTYTDVATVFNQNWLLEVRLANAQGTSITQVSCQLYNRGARRLPVPYFRMTWSDDARRLADTKGQVQQDEKIRFPTDVLDAGASKNYAFEIKRPQPPQRVVAMREQMDWRTTPVKRVDALIIGAEAHGNSDRTKVTPLLAYNFATKDYRPTDPAAAPGVAGAGPAYGLPSGPSETANHNVPLRKYVEVSKEVRRLPVALVLVVDSANVNDVITAMSNSRLNFQVTQAVLNRIPSLGPPARAISEVSGGAGPGTAPADGMPTSAGGTGQMSRTSTSGGAGTASSAGGGGTRPASGGTPVGVVDDSSVVVLQIYGMITLYESPDAEARIQEERQKATAAAKPAGQ